MSIEMQESTTDESEPELQRSLIADYCLRAMKNGYESCIWLCIRQGKRYNLVDIPIATKGQTIGFADIRKRYDWWKRHSLYSVTGVREVQARVLDADQTTQKISAVVTAFDVDENIKRLDKAINETQIEDLIDGECDIDIRGQRQCAGSLCANVEFLGETELTYCKKEKLDNMELRRSNYKWLKPMLEYYWQRGIDEAGVDFLEESGFVVDYE